MTWRWSEANTRLYIGLLALLPELNSSAVVTEEVLGDLRVLGVAAACPSQSWGCPWTSPTAWQPLSWWTGADWGRKYIFHNFRKLKEWQKASQVEAKIRHNWTLQPIKLPACKGILQEDASHRGTLCLGPRCVLLPAMGSEMPSRTEPPQQLWESVRAAKWGCHRKKMGNESMGLCILIVNICIFWHCISLPEIQWILINTNINLNTWRRHDSNSQPEAFFNCLAFCLSGVSDCHGR